MLQYETSVGIDPGINGAIAVISEDEILYCEDMPVEVGPSRKRVNPVELAELIWFIRKQYRPRVCIIEQVHSMKQDGHVGAFSFGHGFGVVRGVVAALNIPIKEIPQNGWKGIIGLNGKGKSGSRSMASRVFKNAAEHMWLVKHHGRADAALLATFGLYPVPWHLGKGKTAQMAAQALRGLV